MNAKSHLQERKRIAELQQRYDLTVRFVDSFWIIEGDRVDEAVQEIKQDPSWRVATSGHKGEWIGDPIMIEVRLSTTNDLIH